MTAQDRLGLARDPGQLLDERAGGAATHRYRTVDVPVGGGDLRVGVWDPVVPGEGDAAAGLPVSEASVLVGTAAGGLPVPGASASVGGAAPTVLAIHGVTSSHLAWPFVVEQLPGVRVVTPDLRGRGGSNELAGPAGLAAHARDMAAVLDALDVDRAVVVGHSMGGFVSVALHRLAPERVERLVLVDGGLPLDAPPGLSPDELVAAILGPTAERLSKRFAGLDDYLGFWSDHPAFAGEWTPELENYFAYDLVPDDGGLRPATSYQTTVEDTIDMNTGTTLAEALSVFAGAGGGGAEGAGAAGAAGGGAAGGGAAGGGSRPLFITVPRGLRDEAPGLYPAEYVDGLLERLPAVRHVRLDGLNHYTIVMSPAGAKRVGELLREEMGS